LAREGDAMISGWRNQQDRRQRDEAETRCINWFPASQRKLETEDRLNSGEHDARFGQHLYNALI